MVQPNVEFKAPGDAQKGGNLLERKAAVAIISGRGKAAEAPPAARRARPVVVVNDRADVVVAQLAPCQQLITEYKGIEVAHQHILIGLEAAVKSGGQHQLGIAIEPVPIEAFEANGGFFNAKVLVPRRIQRFRGHEGDGVAVQHR